MTYRHRQGRHTAAGGWVGCCAGHVVLQHAVWSTASCDRWHLSCCSGTCLAAQRLTAESAGGTRFPPCPAGRSRWRSSLRPTCWGWRLQGGAQDRHTVRKERRARVNGAAAPAEAMGGEGSRAGGHAGRADPGWCSLLDERRCSCAHLYNAQRDGRRGCRQRVAGAAAGGGGTVLPTAPHANAHLAKPSAPPVARSQMPTGRGVRAVALLAPAAGQQRSPRRVGRSERPAWRMPAQTAAGLPH